MLCKALVFKMRTLFGRAINLSKHNACSISNNDIHIIVNEYMHGKIVVVTMEHLRFEILGPYKLCNCRRRCW